MGEYNFNRRQCLKALIKLGFYYSLKQRRGKHDKYDPPASLKEKIVPPNPIFIMIPRHNELRCQHEIIDELRAMGGDELVNKFKNYL